MRLYSYCLRYDDGAAPNPYWDLCTLVICKPAIRRAAEIGDWLVGLGSANSPMGDVSNSVVYAMQITDKMTMLDYDLFCTSRKRDKIPNFRSPDYRRRMGDCIYDYSMGDPPKLRWGIHREENRERDLSGKYALLSEHFYYFGDRPVQLPVDLYPVIHATQGHKSDANQPYVAPFIEWIDSLGFRSNKLYGEPQLKPEYSRASDVQSKCSIRSLEAADDEIVRT